jgi:hypothetical protein
VPSAAEGTVTGPFTFSSFRVSNERTDMSTLHTSSWSLSALVVIGGLAFGTSGCAAAADDDSAQTSAAMLDAGLRRAPFGEFVAHRSATFHPGDFYRIQLSAAPVWQDQRDYAIDVVGKSCGRGTPHHTCTAAFIEGHGDSLERVTGTYAVDRATGHMFFHPEGDNTKPGFLLGYRMVPLGIRVTGRALHNRDHVFERARLDPKIKDPPWVCALTKALRANTTPVPHEVGTSTAPIDVQRDAYWAQQTIDGFSFQGRRVFLIEGGLGADYYDADGRIVVQMSMSSEDEAGETIRYWPSVKCP